MGNSCSSSYDNKNVQTTNFSRYSTPTKISPDDELMKIILIQHNVKSLLAKKKIEKKLNEEINNFEKQWLDKVVSTTKEKEIRWEKLISLEKESNLIYGKYSYEEAFPKNNRNYHINYSLFTFSYQSVSYSEEIIYKGSWKYGANTNKYFPCGIGNIIKINELKNEAVFSLKNKDSFPYNVISSNCRIFYPNDRIYLGQIKIINKIFLPQGQGRLFFSPT